MATPQATVTVTSTIAPSVTPQTTATIVPATPTSAPTATAATTATASPSPTKTPVPTPVCTAEVLTPAQTEGPYFKAGSPERKSLLEAGVTSPKLILSGYVLTRDCRPIQGAKIDFWQADANGAYDNSGFKMRGHQFTDVQGKYTLETVYPGLYPGRTRHIHVMITFTAGFRLTTQLYFPGEPRNASDGIFDQRLVVAIQDVQDGKVASFNFVLSTGCTNLRC